MTITRVSVDSAGNQGNSFSGFPSISADGRFVAFSSGASNLVPGDTNNTGDIFVRDRLTNTTTRVSVDSAGNQANSDSNSPSISADGRFVAFYSDASNIVPGDTNSNRDIFVRDRLTNTTTRVSLDSAGNQANNSSRDPSISADGRFVAFVSFASNLVPGDTNRDFDIFVRDTLTNTTIGVSVDSAVNQGNTYSYSPSISADGRFVAFISNIYNPSNIMVADALEDTEIFVRDTLTNTTTRLSVDSAGNQGNGSSSDPSISADGRFVAFSSDASNIVPGDTNNRDDIFVWDTLTNTTTRVSVDSAGNQRNSGSYSPSISADGRFVAFDDTSPPSLFIGDFGGQRTTFISEGIFVRDTLTNTTTNVSVDSAGNSGEGERPSISADGRFVR